MDISIIQTEHAPAPVGPYSQAITAGGLIFVSGQIALDPSTGKMVQDSIESETEMVLKNMQAILIMAGVNMKKVLKTTIFLTDISTFDTVNHVYAQAFEGHAPARETVEVSKLPKNARVEISCIAAAL